MTHNQRAVWGNRWRWRSLRHLSLSSAGGLNVLLLLVVCLSLSMVLVLVLPRSGNRLKLLRSRLLTSLLRNAHENDPRASDEADLQCYMEYMQYDVNSPRMPPSAEMHFFPNCTRRRPNRSICEFGKEHSPQKRPSQFSCPRAKQVTFCQEDGELDDSSGERHWSCDKPPVCGPGPLQLGLFNKHDGQIHWVPVYPPFLASLLPQVARNTSFCFIKCHSRVKKLVQFREQLLTFPATEALRLASRERKRRRGKRGKGGKGAAPTKRQYKRSKRRARTLTDVTIILIDSMSRSHFYRSLPKTQQLLRNINSASDASGYYSALDFRLANSFFHRTFENIGHLFWANFSGESESDAILPIGHLFKPFKEKGYVTMYMDDLCLLSEWGMVKEMRAVVGETFLDEDKLYVMKDLRHKLTNHRVDSIGLTAASCRLLEREGSNTPFHEMPHICVNGRHQVDYYLSYLGEYEEQLRHRQMPYINYLQTNVGHDETAFRIQVLDEPLAKYLNDTVHSTQNSLVLMFADHGSNYGAIAKENPAEAVTEIFHPSLFLLVPPQVKRRMGTTFLQRLVAAQHKLVNLDDARQFITCVLHNRFTHACGNFLSRMETSRTCGNLKFDYVTADCICDDVIPRKVADPGLESLLMDNLEQLVREAAERNFKNKGSGSTWWGSRSCAQGQLVKFKLINNRTAVAVQGENRFEAKYFLRHQETPPGETDAKQPQKVTLNNDVYICIVDISFTPSSDRDTGQPQTIIAPQMRILSLEKYSVPLGHLPKQGGIYLKCSPEHSANFESCFCIRNYTQ